MVVMGIVLREDPTGTDMTAMLQTTKNLPEFKIIPWLAVFKRCAPQEKCPRVTVALIYLKTYVVVAQASLNVAMNLCSSNDHV